MTRKLFLGVQSATMAAGVLALGSCLKAPDYPVVPAIAFNSLTLQSYGRPREARNDSVRVTISFQDGDGDLGLGGSRFGVAADAQPPFAERNIDGSPNRYNKNFFANIYLKNRTTGLFEKLPDAVLPSGNFNERFPRLISAETKAAPLKGTISRTYGFSLGSPFEPGDEVRFDITIADRALHESNTVTTSSFVIPPR